MTEILYQRIHNIAEPRDTEFDGREFTVFPVVLLVEGVHAGQGAGPVLYTKKLLKNTSKKWDGRPIPVYHPQGVNGQWMSANSPQVMQKRVVGQVFNSMFEPTPKARTKGEMWIDNEKIETVHPGLLALMKTKPEDVDVSTGMEGTLDLTNGEWNNEKYDGEVKDFYPDHLALLPGVAGACSYKDGCGIQNEEGGGDMAKDDTIQLMEIQKLETQIKDLETKITNQNEAHKREVEEMAKKEGPCCPEKVDALIKDGLFNSTQRGFLLELPAAGLDAFVTLTNQLEQAKRPVRHSKVEALLNHADKALGGRVAAAINLFDKHEKRDAAKKASMIEKVLANSRNSFTKEQLEANDTTYLTNIMELLEPSGAAYTTQGGTIANKKDAPVPMGLPGENKGGK